MSAAAAAAPNQVALITDERTWTFAELLEASRALDDGDGVHPSGRGQSLRGPIALWGRRTPSSLLRLYSLLEDRELVTLLHPSWTEAAAREAMERVGARVEVDGESVRRLESSGRPPERSDSVEQLDRPGTVVLFTSGTTGQPKGVVLSRSALVAAAKASARRLGWRADDRWLLRLPIAHVGGLSIVTRCLAARVAVVLDPSSSFEPRTFLERLKRTRTTLVSLVPTMLHRLVDAGLRAPDTVRLALIGGAAARPELLQRAADLGWPTATTYGMTEACSQIATAAPEDWGRPVDHVGRELDSVEVRLVREDAEGEPSEAKASDVSQTEPVGEGEAGLLEIRGPSLFDGYLGEHVRRSAGQWFRTGDWARRGPDGNLRILARRTDLIVTGGENVAPTRVEHALTEHPGVEDACVVGLDDPEWGQSVAALLVARDPQEKPRDVEVLQFLRSRLTRFELPRRLMWVDNVPTMASGKIDRRAASQQFGSADAQETSTESELH